MVMVKMVKMVTATWKALLMRPKMERILIERLKLHLSSSSGGAPLEKELYISKLIIRNLPKYCLLGPVTVADVAVVRDVADVADVTDIADAGHVADVADIIDVADVGDVADVADVGDDKERWVAP